MISARVYETLCGFAGGRVYPMLIPENSKYPAICYQIISKTPVYSLNRMLDDLSALVQVDVYAKDYDQLIDLEEKILNKYKNVEDICFCENSITTLEEETGLLRKIITFKYLT